MSTIDPNGTWPSGSNVVKSEVQTLIESLRDATDKYVVRTPSSWTADSYARSTDGVVVGSTASFSTALVQVKPGQKGRFTLNFTGSAAITAVLVFYTDTGGTTWLSSQFAGPGVSPAVDSYNQQEFTVPDTAYSMRITVLAAEEDDAILELREVTDGTVAALVQDVASLKAAARATDYFSDDQGQVVGYIKGTDGTLVVSANWRSTVLIPVSLGQVFTLTAKGSSSVATVALYDSSGAYITYGLIDPASTGFASYDYEITNPDVAFIRASSSITTVTPSLLGSATAEGALASVFAPSTIYAVKDEPLDLYSAGVCADPAFSLTWSLPGANNTVATVTPTTTADISVTLRARGPDGVPRDAASATIKVADTPTSPASAENFIFLGDSLIKGYVDSGTTLHGAIPNEVMRRLTGTGDALLSGAQSPTALSLTNIYNRGTITGGTVLHEGRQGWSATDYLNTASGNAFWSGTEFDLGYYLTNNSFRAADTAGGVDSTGSNLTIFIMLGWNDVYTSDVETSTVALGSLIDAIKATHADTRIVIFGLNPAPSTMVKTFTGSRWVSQREVFEQAVKSYGEAYRSLAAEKTNTTFLQVSHVMDAESAYTTTTPVRSQRSATTYTATVDHVHPAAAGYAMIADEAFRYIAYTYCQ